MNYDKAIGKILRRRRRQLELTQKCVANVLNIDQAQWSRIETGKAKLIVSQLLKLRDILKIAVRLSTQTTLVKTCACGFKMTTDNSEYIGIGLGLDHWVCPNCGTTVGTKTGAIKRE